MLELRALLLDLCELGLALMKRAMIASPGKDAIWPSDSMSSEGPNDDYGKGWHCNPADQRENAVRSPHDVIRRITKGL